MTRGKNEESSIPFSLTSPGNNVEFLNSSRGNPATMGDNLDDDDGNDDDYDDDRDESFVGILDIFPY